MKTIYLFITCILVQYVAFAQDGVNFRDLTFNEALAQAKAEKKMVFMDCYTSWCGPCKNMTNNVFPQKAAGDYFNSRFVCVKYDMEKGEGKELANKFEVHAYPTFIIFRPDGTIQHRVVGGDELETFIQRVERGLNEKTSLPYLSDRYEKGKMNKQELMTYKEILSEAGEDEKAGKVYNKLLSRLTDKDKVKKNSGRSMKMKVAKSVPRYSTSCWQIYPPSGKTWERKKSTITYSVNTARYWRIISLVIKKKMLSR